MNKIIKILIIGQAPALQKQTFPYDTTMFYDWLEEIGISKEKVISLCDFEAMTDKAPKIGKNGGHLAPSKKDGKTCFTLIHPSKRNILLFRNNKEKIFKILKEVFF